MILCCGEALIDMIPSPTKARRDGFVPHAGGAVFNTAIAFGRSGASGPETVIQTKGAKFAIGWLCDDDYVGTQSPQGTSWIMQAHLRTSIVRAYLPKRHLPEVSLKSLQRALARGIATAAKTSSEKSEADVEAGAVIETFSCRVEWLLRTPSVYSFTSSRCNIIERLDLALRCRTKSGAPR